MSVQLDLLFKATLSVFIVIHFGYFKFIVFNQRNFSKYYVYILRLIDCKTNIMFSKGPSEPSWCSTHVQARDCWDISTRETCFYTCENLRNRNQSGMTFKNDRKKYV